MADEVEKTAAGRPEWLVGAVLGGLVLVAGLIVFLVGLGTNPDFPPAAVAPPPVEAPANALPADLAADPLLARLNREGTLPFTAGPWVRAAWRDSIYDRFTEPVKVRATKITTASGTYAIVIR